MSNDELEAAFEVLADDSLPSKLWRASEKIRVRIGMLAQHVSELEKSLENARKERDAALADNAALPAFCAKEAFDTVRRARWGHSLPRKMTLEEYVPQAVAEAVARKPHPGATLLVELAEGKKAELQAEADERALHDALGWAWAGSHADPLPAPSRAVAALVAVVKKLEADGDAMRERIKGLEQVLGCIAREEVANPYKVAQDALKEPEPH